MPWKIHGYGSEAQLVAAFVSDLTQRLRQALATRGRAAMAVSGGTTPVNLFRHLAMAPLDWERVTVTLVDERWVPENDADSNAGLVKKYLLQEQAASARFIGLKTQADDATWAVGEVEAQLQAIDWPLDIAILGMGEDGHTASYFPGAANLAAAMDPTTTARVCAIKPPAAKHDRMTLTLPVLLETRHLYLHLTGSSKWQVLQEAMAAGSDDELPVSRVLQQARKPIHIYYRNGT